jgi:hypothetical protein
MFLKMKKSKQELPDQATIDVVGIVNEVLRFPTEAELADVVHITKTDRGLQFPQVLVRSAFLPIWGND